MVLFNVTMPSQATRLETRRFTGLYTWDGLTCIYTIHVEAGHGGTFFDSLVFQ